MRNTAFHLFLKLTAPDHIISISHTQYLIVEGRELQPTKPVTENLTLCFSSKTLQTFHRNSVSIIDSIYGGKFDLDVTLKIFAVNQSQTK